MTRPSARFDDLRSGEALRCPPPHRVLVAHHPDQVADVLQEVDRATGRGSWAYGYVAYEAAVGLDRTLPGGEPPAGPPLVWFGLCDEPRRVEPVSSADISTAEGGTWQADWADTEHAEAVAQARKRIAAGEFYQCNLTDRFRKSVSGEPEDLYRRLALAQRGAYNALLDLGEYAIVSASPELFFEWAGDEIRTRPMKGTAPRGRTTAEDDQQARMLRSSDKERAENLMIVDLLRNDLGRVAELGSVCVEELFALERYPTVWQLTSEVSARLRPGTGLLDIFRALFPCGSVTGAPKRRSMQVIRELEAGPRGVYCGAIGLVAPPSAAFRARFSVAIRTAVLDRTNNTAVYGVGGGITWGSDPARERAEVRTKAAVLTHDVIEHQLVETLAWTPAQGLRNHDRHLDRMADSASWLGFHFDRADVLVATRRAIGERTEPARVRVLLTRDGQVTVECAPLAPVRDSPVHLAVDPEPVDSASPWLQHKTTRRDPYDSRALRHPEADDVLLVNERGEVTETTTANLAVLLDGYWCTPPTDSGCLPGVERARLLDLGRLRERRVTLADLREAEAIAVVSSLRGWRSALLLDALAPAAGVGKPPPRAGQALSAITSSPKVEQRWPACRGGRDSSPHLHTTGNVVTAAEARALLAGRNGATHR